MVIVKRMVLERDEGLRLIVSKNLKKRAHSLASHFEGRRVPGRTRISSWAGDDCRELER